MTQELTLGQGIADWISSVKYDDLSDEVRIATRKALVNSIGTAIGAFHLEDVQLALAHGLSENAPGPSTVLVSGKRLAPGTAAFVNGVMFNTLGQEETHLQTGTHPSETTVPVALTLAELEKRSGRDLIEAVLIGIEVTTAVAGMSLTPAVKYDKCESPAVYGTIGSAAAAARLCGLDRNATAHALGLAANFAAGLSQCFRVEGTDEYHFIVALASLHGYMAAKLAAAGAIAAQRSLEGESGFYHLFGSVPREALARHDIVEDVCGRLGNEWATPELIYKPYPVYYFNQAFVEGARLLRERHQPKPEAIRSIRIEVGALASNSGALILPPFDARGNVLGATAFCVASMLARGTLTLADTQDFRAGDILELIDRTEIVTDDGLTTARITVNTDDSNYHLDAEKEGIDLRLEEAAIGEIFRGAARNSLPSEQADELLAALIEIETTEDVSTILPLAVAANAG